MSQTETAIRHPVRAQIDGAIGHLTLCNPDKFNALPQAGWEAVPAKVLHLVDAGARAIIVSGEGENFCAGADISEFDTVRKNTDTARIYEASNVAAFSALREAAVPTIAKIKGFCLGGGFGLAAACDLRLSDTTSQFSVPAAKLGLGYPVEAMADIVRAIGTQNTRHMLLSARRFDAEKIKHFGFLAQLTPPDGLDDAVNSLANAISTLAPLTHRATKAAIDAALGGDIAAAITASDATFTSDDYREGRAAFREKRPPVFKGR